MDFITLNDVVDEIVEVTQDEVDDANSFLLGIAKRMHISEERIVTPAVWTVKRLGCVYALYIACTRCMGKDNLTSLNTEALRMDIYAQKREAFKTELDKLMEEIEAADFTQDYSDGYRNIQALRMWYR